MAKFILKRILQMIPVLFIVSVLIFSLIRITPTDPIVSITKGKTISDETRQELRERFYLDKSPVEQYVIWIGNALRLDLGESYQQRQSVTNLIGDRMGITLTLVAVSGLLSVLMAIPIGVVSAVRMNGALDKFLSILTLIFVSSPVFLTAIIFMLIFAEGLKLFPAIGTGTWRHMVLPSFALALNMVALTSRITRTTMIEQLNSDYIRTATAKGIPRRRVIVTYALKNALIPIITVTSIQIGGMLVGAVLVESVFAMGGLGDLLLTAIKTADYPIVQGVTLMLVFVFMCINLLVDVLYAVLDPRIRHQ